MPYRDKLDAASGTGKLITVRRYLDPVAAQMDRTLLSANGIESHVFEAASYNPLLSGAAGGTQLQVREGDLQRVERLLEVHPGEAASNDEEEEAGGVRCPRCELAYCFHERLRLEGSSASTALTILAAPLLLFLPRRWHCHKCGHVWDDPKEGPAAITKLEEGDPRPVFRLRRAHSGMGLFLGLFAGFCGALLVTAALPRAGGELAFAVLVGAPFIGWAVGRWWQYDLCSEPGCRTALTSDRSECPRCSGAIAGVIRSADEHYAAAADFRRELSALRAADRAREGEKKKRTKKRPASASG